MNTSTDSPPATPRNATGPARPHATWPGAFLGLWSLLWRSRLAARRLPMALGAVLLIPGLVYLTVEPGKTEPYLNWLAPFYLLLLLPLYCLSVFGAMIREDLQANTLGFLTTRPLTRARLFFLKFACELVWFQLVAAVAGSLLLMVGALRDVPGTAGLVPLFLGVQALAILAYGALSALVGLLTPRYMVLGILYGFIVEIGIGRIPTNIHNLSLAHHIRTLLANSEMIQGLFLWSATGTARSVGLMAGAVVVFLIAGAALFTWREYHHVEEMQK
jgi:ABC-type transport system involved in multi-copper enzyme maturation permease subunit